MTKTKKGKPKRFIKKLSKVDISKISLEVNPQFAQQLKDSGFDGNVDVYFIEP